MAIMKKTRQFGLRSVLLVSVLLAAALTFSKAKVDALVIVREPSFCHRGNYHHHYHYHYHAGNVPSDRQFGAKCDIILTSTSLKNNLDENNHENNHEHNHEHNHNHNHNHNAMLSSRRRSILTGSTVPLMLLLTSWTLLPTSAANAVTGSMQTSQYSGSSSGGGKGNSKAKKINPQVAFENLLRARQELIVGQTTYLSKRDLDGLRDYLTGGAGGGAEAINNFEANALAILASKRLDEEDKKAIGTIRTYGAGADVIIMYGGLLNEIDESNEEPSYGAAQKYLSRALDSLNEVIAICRNSGAFD